MTYSEFSFGNGPFKEGPWAKMVLISLGLHLLVLTLFLNVLPHGAAKRNLEPAYVVDLVSSLGEGSAGNKTKESLFSPAPHPARRETKPVIIPRTVSEKPPEVKKMDSKVLDQALEKIKKRVELDQALGKIKKRVEQEKSLENTLSRLENQVKDEQKLEKALSRIEKKNQSASTASSAGQGTGLAGPGTVSSSAPGVPDGLGIQFQLYHASLRSRIKKNWVLPEGLLKRNDISAQVMIRISRPGRIEDFRFERKSGIEAFDQEVIRTIKKSDPLPPLPEGFPKNSYEVILTFHSKDLSGN
jgi:TonB family protein